MLDLLIPSAMADAGAAAAPAGGMGQLIFIVLIGLVFYFLLIRPQNKRMKEHRQMVTALQKGDEVVTNGGLIGKITDVNEQILTVMLAQNVEVKLQKHAVATILPKGTFKGTDAKATEKKK